MADAYIGLGSNLGDRIANLEAARRAIESGGGKIQAASQIYETAPWGPVAQGDYLNQVIRIETGKTPRALLDALRAIETALGRDRANEVRYGPRKIDLDILVFGTERIDEPDLTIPHPRILERAFVLVPLAEIAPGLTIGGVGIREALRRAGTAGVRLYET